MHKPLKQSACTPLFYNAYDMRNAGACIHVSLDFPLYPSRIAQVAEINMDRTDPLPRTQTHSQHAVMTTLLWPGKEFRISHQEMIKGMRVGGTGTALSYLDTLVIPIIENTPDEEDLREGMEEVRAHAFSSFSQLLAQLVGFENTRRVSY